MRSEHALSAYLADVRYALAQANLSELSGSRIFITGARGLIGSALVDLCLENGMQVYASGRSLSALERRFFYQSSSSKLSLIEYDVRDKFEFDFPVDLIVHAAAHAHPSAFASEPFETMIGIQAGTQNMLEAARTTSATLLLVSSSEVYGQKTHPNPFTESEFGFVDISQPRSCYPVAKRCAETMCAAHAEEFGTHFVIARPGHVFGPTATSSDSRVASAFPRQAAAHDDIILKSDGRQMRSWCYAADCATALLTILQRGIEGQAYNIANPHLDATLKNFAELVAKKASVHLKSKAPTHEEAAAFNPMDNSALDGTRLAQLNWKPAFSLEEGASKTLEQQGLFI